MKIAIVSGYFNPLHVGHLDYIEAAKKISDKLIVIINNDCQVTIKGSIPFMSEQDRIRIVSALRCVDKVVLSQDEDSSVVETLKHVVIQNQANGRNKFIFCNGGDRGNSNTPEEAFCSNNNYQLISEYNIGGNKAESSSVLINNAVNMQRESQDELKKIEKVLKEFKL